MATCKDCIHKDVCYLIEHYGKDLCSDEVCDNFLETPVRHGHWIQRGRIIAYYECSECHCSIDQEPHYNYSDNIMVFPKYCEYCGAKMDGGEVE